MTKTSIALALLVGCGFAHAQNDVIISSPFEISSAKTTTEPPIVVKKRADFLLVAISLTNDTQEPEHRRDEVYTTLRSMISGVPKDSRIELFTETAALTADNYRISLTSVSGRVYVSGASLYARIPLGESDDAGSRADTLNSFAKSIKGEGRTAVAVGALGLVVMNPEKYRYDVIQAIAVDVKKLREMFGDGFEIVVKGLDTRLQWQRSSVSEVEFYLPFKYEVFPVKSAKVLPLEK
jgi:hypothetical protein